MRGTALGALKERYPGGFVELFDDCLASVTRARASGELRLKARPVPKPEAWLDMTRTQRRNWYKRARSLRGGSGERNAAATDIGGVGDGNADDFASKIGDEHDDDDNDDDDDDDGILDNEESFCFADNDDDDDDDDEDVSNDDLDEDDDDAPGFRGEDTDVRNGDDYADHGSDGGLYPGVGPGWLPLGTVVNFINRQSAAVEGGGMTSGMSIVNVKTLARALLASKRIDTGGGKGLGHRERVIQVTNLSSCWSRLLPRCAAMGQSEGESRFKKYP